MIAAAVQYSPEKGKPDSARRDIILFAEEACSKGASLVVFPEMAVSGYVWSSREEVSHFAEKSDGPTFAALSPIAKKYGSWIICGFAESDGEALYNSALIIGSDGSLVASYRKILLFDMDKTWASPGDTRIIIETEFGSMIPCICMDLNDNGFIDFAVNKQPAVILFCTNWLEEGLDVHYYWNERLRDYRGYFIAANRWGDEENVSFCGNSAIITPEKIISASSEKTGNGIIYSEIRV